MPKINIKNPMGYVIDTVDAEVINDVFAIHSTVLGWYVVHVPTGLHCIKNWNGDQEFDEPFATREKAVTFVNALMAARIMWLVSTRDQLYEINPRPTVKAVVQGARLMANMS